MWEECAALQGEIVQARRALHRIPEVGTELPETAAFVTARLESLGIPYTRSRQDSGIIAVISGGEGPTAALRCDMDALPVQEETGLSFASCRPGKMHACGHDAHMAMLLGAAQVLKAHEKEVHGTVRLLFQTGEEIARGAKIMIAEGAMEGVDAVFGLHVGNLRGPRLPSGTVSVARGCCMASYDRFILRVKGKGVHGSTPEKGIDPILVGAQIVQGLQTITTRELAATRALVLTVGKFQAGQQYNVIPDEVLIEGTTRTLEEEVRQYAARRIGEIARQIAAAYGAAVDYEMDWGAPPVVNDAAMADLAAAAAADVVGSEMLEKHPDTPIMVGEDFACYLQEKPGAFLFLSAADADKGTDVPHHNSHFDVDEDVLWKGSALLVRVVEKFLR